MTTIYVEGQDTRAVTAAEDEYETRYAATFRRAVSAPPERKLAALLGDGVKLPGVGAPTGSTIIHFIHPKTMPIIDGAPSKYYLRLVILRPKTATLNTTKNFGRPLTGLGTAVPVGHYAKLTGLSLPTQTQRGP